MSADSGNQNAESPPARLRALPHSRREWTSLWFFTSLVLVIGMILKEFPVYEAYSHNSFGAWYAGVLFAATISLFCASHCIWRHYKLFSILGDVCGVISLLYLFRPAF